MPLEEVIARTHSLIVHGCVDENGRKQGVYTEYRISNGSIKRTITYKDDLPVEQVVYNRRSRTPSKYTFFDNNNALLSELAVFTNSIDYVYRFIDSNKLLWDTLLYMDFAPGRTHARVSFGFDCTTTDTISNKKLQQECVSFHISSAPDDKPKNFSWTINVNGATTQHDVNSLIEDVFDITTAEEVQTSLLGLNISLSLCSNLRIKEQIKTELQTILEKQKYIVSLNTGNPGTLSDDARLNLIGIVIKELERMVGI